MRATCCHVMDSKWAFGSVEDDPVEDLIRNRNKMAASLEAGFVPEPCKGCWAVDLLNDSPSSAVSTVTQSDEMA